MAVDRETLLANLPDIAALLLKMENGPERAAQRQVVRLGANRPKKPQLVKSVRGRGGYKSYKAYDWEAAAKRRKVAMPDKPGLITSKGYKGV